MENKTVEQLKKEIRNAEIVNRVKKEEEKWNKKQKNKNLYIKLQEK